MGWCAEFGPQIGAGCEHPMVAGDASCHCVECGVVCSGRFRGCGAVWDRGPVQQPVVRRRVAKPVPPVAAVASVDPSPAASVAPGPSPAAAPSGGASTPIATGGDRVSAFLMALDDVRSELRDLHAAVERQQEFLAAAERRERAMADVADLLDHIPARVSAAIRGALAEVGTARTVTSGPPPIDAAEWDRPIDAVDELPPVAPPVPPPGDFRDSA